MEIAIYQDGHQDGSTKHGKHMLEAEDGPLSHGRLGSMLGGNGGVGGTGIDVSLSTGCGAGLAASFDTSLGARIDVRITICVFVHNSLLFCETSD